MFKIFTSKFGAAAAAAVAYWAGGRKGEIEKCILWSGTIQLSSQICRIIPMQCVLAICRSSLLFAISATAPADSAVTLAQHHYKLIIDLKNTLW